MMKFTKEETAPEHMTKKDLVLEVKRLRAQVRRLEAKTPNMDNHRVCSTCHAPVPRGALFCKVGCDPSR